jgi:hypothetical protein
MSSRCMRLVDVGRGKLVFPESDLMPVYNLHRENARESTQQACDYLVALKDSIGRNEGGRDGSRYCADPWLWSGMKAPGARVFRGRAGPEKCRLDCWGLRCIRLAVDGYVYPRRKPVSRLRKGGP